MRKLVLFMHTSLDGFVSGPNGEMDWIKVDDEIFEYAGKQTAEADTALYGRVTYDMMESYWPTAADQPQASRHDIEHSRWYNQVEKVVLSRTLKNDAPRLKIISENLFNEILELKKGPGANILIFGSPSAVHSLMEGNLIDEYWLFVNPVLLATGVPLFKGYDKKIALQLQKSAAFASGVVCLHYLRHAEDQPAI